MQPEPLSDLTYILPQVGGVDPYHAAQITVTLDTNSYTSGGHQPVPHHLNQTWHTFFHKCRGMVYVSPDSRECAVCNIAGLHCWEQHCTKQCYIALYRTVLHCTVWNSVALTCMEQCCTDLYGIVLHCTDLYGTVLHCTDLYGRVLHCTVWSSDALKSMEQCCIVWNSVALNCMEMLHCIFVALDCMEQSCTTLHGMCCSALYGTVLHSIVWKCCTV